MRATERAISGLGRRKDEVGTLMTSFNRMLETIEQQAGDINSFATRLDAAYKELESTNARLKETSFKDEVTGLYHRRFFSLRLEAELSRGRRSAVRRQTGGQEPGGRRIGLGREGFVAWKTARGTS